MPKWNWNETETQLKRNIKETETGTRQSRNRLKQDWHSTERDSTDNQSACFFYSSFRGSFWAMKVRWNNAEPMLKHCWNETEMKQKGNWNRRETGLKQDWNSTERESTDNQWAHCFYSSFTRSFGALKMRRNNAEPVLKQRWNETEMKQKGNWNRHETVPKQAETVPKQDWNSTGRESTDKQWACFFNSSFRGSLGSVI